MSTNEKPSPQRAPSRRAFLGSIALAAAGPLAGCPPGRAGGDDDDSATGPCLETEPDIQGPFYREDAPFREDLNPNGLSGTPLTIEGRVFGDDCATPLAGAVVDVWHCSEDGAYDNASGDFELRGRVRTDSDGMYVYTTIRPGRYLNGAEYRPMHVHYLVTADDHEELVTQLYFEGDEFIASDPWATAARAIPLSDDGNGGLIGTFDIVLARS